MSAFFARYVDHSSPQCYTIITKRATEILIVDDDPAFRRKVREALGGVYRVTEADSEEEFRRLFRPYVYSLVIMDMRLRSGREGLDLLNYVYAQDEFQPTVMVSAYGDTDTTLSAIESGALMFLNKLEFSPGMMARIAEAILRQGRIQRRLADMETMLEQQFAATLVGASSGMVRARQQIRRAAEDPDSLVHVTGEPGTGRRLAARMIHRESISRRTGPMIEAHADVFKSGDPAPALFGARQQDGGPRQKGLCERAMGGVLYLPTAESLPPEVTATLLRTVREGRLEICGEGAPLDFQLILASTTGESEVVFHQVWSPKVEGLKVIDVHVPPLRQRKEDVSALAAFFVQEQRREGGTSARGVSSAVLEILERHRWPGNVRELKNVIEFAGIQAAAQNTHEITPAHLPHTLLHSGETTPESFGKYNYRYHLARTEVWLTHLATIQHKRVSKTDLARELGYNDRFVLTRRLQRNFRDFPSLVPEFPDVAELFGVSVPR